MLSCFYPEVTRRQGKGPWPRRKRGWKVRISTPPRAWSSVPPQAHQAAATVVRCSTDDSFFQKFSYDHVFISQIQHFLFTLWQSHWWDGGDTVLPSSWDSQCILHLILLIYSITDFGTLILQDAPFQWPLSMTPFNGSRHFFLPPQYTHWYYTFS